mmetsp:Transcript_24000/g.76594  ORF Transcript_24000/g.76594 Transcript_24000/m.76594 type:complete len:84 (+) Transcript_24000:186-437(+)
MLWLAQARFRWKRREKLKDWFRIKWCYSSRTDWTPGVFAEDERSPVPPELPDPDLEPRLLSFAAMASGIKLPSLLSVENTDMA